MMSVELAQDGLATALRLQCEDARADGGQSMCPVAQMSANIEAKVIGLDKSTVEVTPAPIAAGDGIVDEERAPQAIKLGPCPSRFFCGSSQVALLMLSRASNASAGTQSAALHLLW